MTNFTKFIRCISHICQYIYIHRQGKISFALPSSPYFRGLFYFYALLLAFAFEYLGVGFFLCLWNFDHCLGGDALQR